MDFIFVETDDTFIFRIP